ncbi:MAG: hypothetical protein SFW36_10830 [Leptolyngbyaceae cyanobacterium bins.59]|nr:hypothetical protein [Leptolyngbyaceae cyanobacterium bins.59]
MTTHFITAEIDLRQIPLTLPEAIEAKLSEQGEPLRWAITEVDQDQQIAHIEAVITREAATTSDVAVSP